MDTPPKSHYSIAEREKNADSVTDVWQQAFEQLQECKTIRFAPGATRTKSVPGDSD